MPSYVVPYAPTATYQPNGRLVDLIRAQGQDAANLALMRGQQSQQLWSGVGNSIQQGVGAVAQAFDPRNRAEAAHATLLEGQAADAADLRSGQRKVDAMMAGDQSNPGDVGPKQESYLDANGLFDVPKMHQALAGMGNGHLAPELLKGAESINDSIAKHQELDQQIGKQKTLIFGDMADGALKLAKLGMPIAQAMDFVVQPGLAAKVIQPQEYAQLKAKIASLPPEQQAQALTTFMDAAAKLGGGKSLGKDATEVDRYGRTVASNIVPEKPTEASLAADLSSPDPTIRARAQTAMAALKPPPVPRPLDQQLLQAVVDGDTAKIGQIKETMLTEAQAKRDPAAMAVANQLANLRVDEAKTRLEEKDTDSDKNQQKFEQQYRTVLTRAMSNRSGGIGSEDAKVQQANHLISVLDQFYDPKTNDWNIPRVQLNELALGLAKLTAPGGQAGEGMLREFQQRTAKGDLAGALTYLTGSPIAANTQAITKMLKDSIERQGLTAEQNREGEMSYLRGLAPTDLNEDRRQKLEATSLNPLRQSRIAVDPQGNKKLFVSIDGGKTWR